MKFSGADGSTAVRRWADLLICEHLALEAMRAIPGVDSARSRVLQHAGRTFLELERFDRHGLHGRSPVCSLFSLNAALLGDSSTDWHLACEAALQFWHRAEQDARISSDFRQRCGANARKIEGWRGLV